MSKIYEKNEELQDKIYKGVEKLTDIVSSTLGPKGRNVILRRKNKNPIITKDGVTIAKFIDFSDPIEDTAAQIIKQASSKTADDAGDGTTTSTVLAHAMYSYARRYIKSGVSVSEIKKGMESAYEDIVSYLEQAAIPVKSIEDVKHVATISANGDNSVGEIISAAVDKVGADGVINIEDGKSSKTILDVVEGFNFDSGYAASAFITDENRKSVKYNDCLFFITDHKLDSVERVLPVLELAARNDRPLVIIAEEIEGQLLAALIMNTIRGSMKIVAIKSPYYGQQRRDFLVDASNITGAKLVLRDAGNDFSEFKLNDFGRSEKVEVRKNRTTIVGGKSDYEKVDSTIQNLKDAMKEVDLGNAHEGLAECSKIQERINRLSSGVAVIKVGGNTEIEAIEKRHRVEDALEAVMAAKISGIHLGGGMALVKAHKNIKRRKLLGDEKLGYDVVFEAIKSPIKQIAKNAGESPDLILSKALGLKGNKGIDMSTGKAVDMLEKGIVDPVLVTCSALKNAVSVVSLLVSTNNAVVEK